MSNKTFGQLFREKRIKNNMTLRSFCRRYGFDTAYISRIENNKMKPPAGDKLEALIDALGVEKGSTEWVKFFDKAHHARNELPEDIKNDAKDLIGMLPAFLRTEDGKRLNKEKLNELIDFLKKN